MIENTLSFVLFSPSENIAGVERDEKPLSDCVSQHMDCFFFVFTVYTTVSWAIARVSIYAPHRSVDRSFLRPQRTFLQSHYIGMHLIPFSRDRWLDHHANDRANSKTRPFEPRSDLSVN